MKRRNSLFLSCCQSSFLALKISFCKSFSRRWHLHVSSASMNLLLFLPLFLLQVCCPSSQQQQHYIISNIKAGSCFWQVSGHSLCSILSSLRAGGFPLPSWEIHIYKYVPHAFQTSLSTNRQNQDELAAYCVWLFTKMLI